MENRLSYIDNVRGLIMAIMAIDHVSFFIRKVHYSEYWGGITNYASTADFLTRFITHICAPGFFLLMGIGMFHFSQKRISIGWSKTKIIKWFLKRGILLILIQQIIENPAWIISVFNSTIDNFGLGSSIPGDDGSNPYLVLSVLFSLGCSLIIGSFLLFSKRIYWLLLPIALFIISEFVIINSNPEIVYNGLLRVLLIAGKTGFLNVLYPIFPWVGITILGFYFASSTRRNSNLFLLASGISLAIFVFYRILLIEEFSLINFLNITKYPPSIGFITGTLSLLFFLLYIFEKFSINLRLLLVFGRVPLFFYLLHIWIYSLVGLDFDHGTSLFSMYAIWFVSMLPFYWICEWYLKFKINKKEQSFWRLL